MDWLRGETPGQELIISLCQFYHFLNANSRISIFFRNFKRPFTPRTKLGSAWNFGKTRFRRFAIFHFSTPKFFLFFFLQKSSGAIFFFWKSEVLEELWLFDPPQQMRRKKLLPQLPLFLRRLPWRRGKRLNMCRNPGLGTKNNFNHLVLWWYDSVMIWWYDNMTGW